MPSVVLHQEAQLPLSGRGHLLDVDLDEHGLVDLLAEKCFECHAGFDLQLLPLLEFTQNTFCYRSGDGLYHCRICRALVMDLVIPGTDCLL